MGGWAEWGAGSPGVRSDLFLMRNFRESCEGDSREIPEDSMVFPQERGWPEQGQPPRESLIVLLISPETECDLRDGTAGSAELWRPAKPSMTFQTGDFSSSSVD